MPGSSAQRIGPYLVVRELGRGGMGVVYEVQRPGAPGRYALKLLRSHNETALQRFHREAELLARLQHPGLLRFVDAGQTPAGPYLVTELVEGTPLNVLCRQGPLEPEDAGRIVRDLCEAVAALHALGILHRDIKPHNVILRPGGNPVLLDFGLARAADVDRLTQTGVLMGTPAYMPPEMAQGLSPRLLDERADVYSLGAVLFSLLSGRLPYEGASGLSLLRKIVTEAPSWPDLQERAPAEGLWAVCRRAMARDRDERYPNAVAMARALDQALRGDLPPARGSRAAWLLPALAGAILGAASLAAVLALRAGSGRGTDEAPGHVPPPDPSLEVTFLEPAEGALVLAPSLAVRGVLRGWGEGRPPSVLLAGRRVFPSPDGAFRARIDLSPGPQSFRAVVETADGRRAEATRTVEHLPCPRWFRDLDPDVRPPLPLPKGLEFRKEQGEYLNRKDGSVLVYVPPGSFVMGPGERGIPRLFGGPGEDAEHRVTLTRGYFIGKYEVTRKQFHRFLAYVREHRKAFRNARRLLLHSPHDSENEELPESPVLFSQAQAYAKWAGLRLPSEAEWEYAARGPEERLFPWGDEARGGRANLEGVHGGPIPGGSYPDDRSPFGCYDMAGNVAEWVAERAGPYPTAPAVDPQRPVKQRAPVVIRGGSFSLPAGMAKLTTRYAAYPTAVDGTRQDFGFRVALSARPPRPPRSP